MEKIERVITALELCTNISQDGCMMLCPYKDDQDETYPGLCEHIMKQDVLELLSELKEHEELLTKLGYHWTGSGETLALCKKTAVCAMVRNDERKSPENGVS